MPWINLNLKRQWIENEFSKIFLFRCCFWSNHSSWPRKDDKEQIKVFLKFERLSWNLQVTPCCLISIETTAVRQKPIPGNFTIYDAVRWNLSSARVVYISTDGNFSAASVVVLNVRTHAWPFLYAPESLFRKNDPLSLVMETLIILILWSPKHFALISTYYLRQNKLFNITPPNF